MLGSTEFLVIALLIALLFGADALAGAAREAGRAKREVEKMKREIEEELELK